MHHFRAKHIDIKHQFNRYHILKGDIDISFVRTEFQLVNIFTKSLLEEKFCLLRKSLSIIAKIF